MVLLLLIYFLCGSSLFVSLFFYAVFCVLSSFEIILMGTRELVAYFSIVLLMSYDVVLSSVAEGWCAVVVFFDHTYFFLNAILGLISGTLTYVKTILLIEGSVVNNT